MASPITPRSGTKVAGSDHLTPVSAREKPIFIVALNPNTTDSKNGLWVQKVADARTITRVLFNCKERNNPTNQRCVLSAQPNNLANAWGNCSPQCFSAYGCLRYSRNLWLPKREDFPNLSAVELLHCLHCGRYPWRVDNKSSPFQFPYTV